MLPYLTFYYFYLLSAVGHHILIKVRQFSNLPLNDVCTVRVSLKSNSFMMKINFRKHFYVSHHLIINIIIVRNIAMHNIMKKKMYSQ